jgi:hypothetical protein
MQRKAIENHHVYEMSSLNKLSAEIPEVYIFWPLTCQFLIVDKKKPYNL